MNHAINTPVSRYQARLNVLVACLSVCFLGGTKAWAKLPPQLAPIVTTPQPTEQLAPPEVSPVKQPLELLTPLETLLEASPPSPTNTPHTPVSPDVLSTPTQLGETVGQTITPSSLHYPDPHADQPPPAHHVHQPHYAHEAIKTPEAFETALITIKSIELLRTGHYKPAFILWRLGNLAEGDTLTLAQLQHRIARLNNLEPSLKVAIQVKQIVPGSPEVTLHIKVYEKTPYQLALTADNQGRPLIGMYRGGAIISHDNVLGYGDKAQLNWVGGGNTSQGRITYDIPINLSGGRFLTWGELGRVTTNELPGNHFGRENQGSQMSFGFNLTQPLNAKRTWQFEGGYTNRHAFTTVDGFKDPTINTRILLAGIRYLNKDPYGQINWSLGSMYQPKLFGTNFTFWGIRSQLLRTLDLPHQQRLTLRAGAQLTNTPLPAASQVIYGGAYSARGYTEGMVTADRGLQASLEYQTPIWGMKRISPWLSERTALVSFIDFAHGWYDTSNARFALAGSSRQAGQLLSVGVGIRYRLSPYMQGFVDAGFPLVNTPERLALNSQPTVRIHFGIRSNLITRKWHETE
jgi:hemolysin activation/secretion protein